MWREATKRPKSIRSVTDVKDTDGRTISERLEMLGRNVKGIRLIYTLLALFVVQAVFLVTNQHVKPKSKVEIPAMNDQTKRSEKFDSNISDVAVKLDEDIRTIAVESAPKENENTEKIKENVVLGVAFNTDAKYFAVFCGSLVEHARTTTRAVVFINTPVPQSHLDIVESGKKHNRKVIEIVEVDESKLEDKLRKIHSSSLRWQLYYNFLNTNDRFKAFEHVWMLDVRDTVFFGDPFYIFDDDVHGSHFHTWQEGGGKRIADCGWNGGWVKDCFGDTVLNSVGGQNIICSGASAGSIDAVSDYLLTMKKLFNGEEMTFGPRNENHFLPRCERNGVDQGIHNVLVHDNKIKNLHVHTERDGYLVHMQSSTMSVINGDEVLDAQGKKLIVVHQYDRSFDLMRRLAAKYVTWIDVRLSIATLNISVCK